MVAVAAHPFGYDPLLAGDHRLAGVLGHRIELADVVEIPKVQRLALSRSERHRGFGERGFTAGLDIVEIDDERGYPLATEDEVSGAARVFRWVEIEMRKEFSAYIVVHDL